MVQLRDYQEQTLDHIKDAFVDGLRRLMVQLPTGSGKTKLAAQIVEGARGKKKRIIFEVPQISLVDQTVDAFSAEGMGGEIGVIQAKHFMTDWSKPIQIASVQTLQQGEIPKCDVVLRDEAHKMFTFDNRWMADPAWSNIPQIGLSATPWAKGLGMLYQRLIVATTTAELIQRGYLVPFRVFAPTSPDLSKVRTFAGDYAVNDLLEVMNKAKLVGDIVVTWQRMAENRPTICFCVDRTHANSLRERFEAAGVPAGYMDCKTPLKERKVIREAFKAGAIRVVCNVDIVGIGIDWPEIACISYCRPTKSEMRFVQNIGRGLRPSPGKKDLLILDHSDTHTRLGFVTDINHETLDGARVVPNNPVTAVRLPKACPKCTFIKPFGVRVCAQCGHETAPPPAVKEYTEAELAEFNGKKKRDKKSAATWDKPQRAMFYAELKRWCLDYGKKPGWAWMKYKARFDGMPPDRDIEDVAPAIGVSHATRNWIKKENMAYAKAMRKGNGAHGVHAP